MARLNEPPIVGESVEALKRRFMRQNRELAKSNSELKIKVATLEADRAQLLSENITLRSHVNHFKQEAERDYTKQAIQNVGLVKDKLVAKVAELTELMAELDTAQAEPPKPEPAANTARRRSYRRSPTQVRNWKNSLCGPEITGLEPILEDKFFPRRSLGADEIQSIQEDIGTVTNSPELGSPPIAHFETLGSLEYASYQPETKGEDDSIMEREHTALLSHVEARRKRRASIIVHEQEIEAPDPNIEPEKPKQPEVLPKAGAKRKFGNPFDHEVLQADGGPRTSLADNTNFSFTRKSTTATGTPANRHVKPLPARNQAKTTNQVSVVGDTKIRKALGEKTVNTDPVVSPVKARVSNDKPDRVDLLEKVKERQRQRQEVKNDSKVEKTKSVPKSIETLPITPGPIEADLFSPTDSIPSAQPANRDTPPPSELTSKAAENVRPSRRQRAQVSYAEPSLRDKMRRPGKELADAVVIGKTTTKDDMLKEEDISIPNWKSTTGGSEQATEPNSPLQNKSSNLEEPLPATVLTGRRRKSTQRASDIELELDASRSTVASVSQRRMSRTRDAEVQPATERSSSDVFTLDGSSPEVSEPRAISKQSRRHSSMADVRNKKEVTFKISKQEKLDEEVISRAERSASRRRSMQL